MRLTTATLAATLIALPACDDPKPKTPDAPAQTNAAAGETSGSTAAAEATDPAATPARKKAPKKPFTPAKEQPDEGKKLARTFRKHLNAGRELVKAKKYAEGIAELERALAIDPNDSRALSELGWAAFLSDDLPRAEAANEASVKYAANDRIKGASLYNLGRVSEKRGDTALARGYYEQSLAARPNKIVQKRLDALLAANAPAAATPPGLCGFDPMPGLETAGAVLKALHKNDEDFYGSEPGVYQEVEIDHPKLTRAALVGYYMADEPMVLNVALALEVGGTWHASDVATEYNPGAFGIHEDLSFEDLEVTDLVPGGAPEVVLKFSHDRSDTDMGIDEWESEKRAGTYVAGLGADEGSPTLLLYVATRASYERDRLGHLADSEIDKSYATKGLPIKESSGVDLAFDAKKGEVTVTQVSGMSPSYKPGTYPLATFPQRCL
jgi:tetratricopeptide (TPR) repeat protein